MDKTLEIILDCIGTKHGAGKELAEYLGISPNVITNWKNGSNKSYRKHLKKLAEYFNVSIDYLLGNEKKPTTENGSELDDNEQNLVDTYRDMTPKGQKVLLDTAETLHENFKKEADTISDNDKVG